MIELSEKDLARFWSYVDRRGDDECWPWLAEVNSQNGSGVFRFQGKRSVAAYRFSYCLANGPIPNDILVYKTCSNSLCINPQHSFVRVEFIKNAFGEFVLTRKLCPVCNEMKDIETEYSRRKDRTCQAKCKDCMSDISRKTRNKETNRIKSLRKYNITLEEYNELFDKQKGVCKICKSTGGTKPLYVDHCHSTNFVRGLLCNNCNSGLGMFKDDVVLLASAIEYINSGVSA